MCSKGYGNSRPDRLGIYLHFPFCRRKCPYCGFNSKATTEIPEKLYVEALLKELELLVEEEGLSKRRVDTVYFGGGTPSLLSSNSIERLLGGIARRLTLDSSAEITIEVNPESAKKRKLKGFLRAGINRVVIGMQSLSPKGLKALGRTHSTEDSLRAFEDALKAGFSNIGVDLIYALPEQTPSEWLEELSTVVTLKPTHISAYELTVEEGTPFKESLVAGRLKLPAEEEILCMYKEGSALLKDEGYLHYEVSNFSLDGYRCRHNLKYWHCEDYLGLGVAAHSWLRGWAGGVRWQNPETLEDYLKPIGHGRPARIDRKELSREEAFTERLIMGMRLFEGIEYDRLTEEFGIRLKDSALWAGLIEEGLIEEEGSTIRFTNRGMLLSDEILTLLMSS